MFHLELTSATKKDLRKLPKKIQEEILSIHLPLIEKDPFGTGRPLVGVFKCERSYHFGRNPEYRIIYFMNVNSIIVTIIGTRENIYKKAKLRR